MRESVDKGSYSSKINSYNHPHKDVPMSNEALPKDLEDLQNSVRALVLNRQLLNSTKYAPEDFQKFILVDQFVGSLHEQSLKSLLEHPQGDLIPEVKNIKAERHQAELLKIKEEHAKSKEAGAEAGNEEAKTL